MLSGRAVCGGVWWLTVILLFSFPQLHKAQVEINTMNAFVNEGDGYVMVCAVIGSIDMGTTITRSTAFTRNFSAVDSMDFSPISGYDLGFSTTPDPGETRCVNVTITDDSVQEGTEVFALETEFEYSFDSFSDSGDETTFVRIIDNDVTVSVSPSVSVGEGDTDTVCVTLTGASSATVISDPIIVTLNSSQTMPGMGCELSINMLLLTFSVC
jgi:hypothetical protein